MECPCEPVASEPTESRGANLDKTRSTHGRNYRLFGVRSKQTSRCFKMQKSGFSTESRSRGYKSGGGLGESKCMGWRLQRPLGNCREGEWAGEKQCSPRRLTEQRQSKGLVIWTFPPRYLAREKILFIWHWEPWLGTQEF